MGVIATAGLLLLVALVVAKSAGPGQRLCWDLTDPDVTLRLITFVAACAVIDTRLSSNVWVARVLGGVGLASWLVLIVYSARNMWRAWSSSCVTTHTAPGNLAVWEPRVWRS